LPATSNETSARPSPLSNASLAASGGRLASAPSEAFESGDGRADVSFEVSGNPVALDAAIETTGDDGRIVVGSWYGAKPATLDLGGRFHRSHIRLQASQVSQLDAVHADRWDKQRRMDLVIDLLSELTPAELVTHHVPVEEAPRAYRLLDESPDEALAVLLTY
jgi:alcohol dehydrogenase